MRRLAALTLTTLLLATGALALPACTGPQVVADDPDPDAHLQQGLQQVFPYDFDQRTLGGLRWLDNYALNQPQTPAALRARHWILRARIDWLTAAYVEDDPQRRVELLIALMDHLGVEHADEIDNQAVFAVLETLDAQAHGLEAVPDYATSAASARYFLGMLRHLDLAPGYFEATVALGLNNVPPEQGVAFPPGGPQDFALNGLLVVLADLSTHLPAAAHLDPSRQAHGYARLLAYACPTGFSAFASSSLEDRLRPLQEACGWPCPKGTDADPLLPPWKTCPRALASPPELYSLDNEVTLRALGRLQRLRDWARAADRDATPDGPYPLLRKNPNLLKRLLAGTSITSVPLALPEHDQHTLADAIHVPVARYAPHPGLSPIVVIVDADTLRVAAPPWATLDAEDHVHTTLDADDPRAAWSFPGRALPPEATRPILADPDHADLAPLIAELRSLLEAQAKAHELTVEALLKDDLPPPSLLLDAAAPAALVQAIGSALHAAGFRRVQIAVADPLFHRMAALSLELVQTAAPTAPLVALDAAGLGFRTDPAAKSPARLPRAPALPATELYRALFPLAARQPHEIVKQLTLELHGGSVDDLVHVIDAVRYWRQLPDAAAALDVVDAEPQDAGGVPRLLVGYFAIVVP